MSHKTAEGIENVDKYIDQFNDEVKQRLLMLRELVLAEVPEADEGIMYGLVGYKLRKKPLVYFGGFTHYIGFYATPNGHEAFAGDFAKYKQGKGSVQFPNDEPLPIDLVKRVVAYRVEQVS